MKRIHRILICGAVAASITTVAILGASAGTRDNPFVSLEYLKGAYKTELKNELYSELSAMFSSSETTAPDVTEPEQTEPEHTEAPEENDGGIIGGAVFSDNGDIIGTSGVVGTGSTYAVVHIKKGQKLEAKASCEIILRSGHASAFVASEANRASGVGLADFTAGGEITHGTDVPSNHLLLVPRADGRGISVTSDEAYIMVRGEFTIVDEGY